MSSEPADINRVERLLAEVREQPSRFASPDDLARFAGIGRAALHRLFETHVHATPQQVLHRAVMQAAAQCLTRDGRSPRAVAEELGFEEGAFGVAFKEQFGLSPALFRGLAKQRSFTMRLPEDFRSEYALRIAGRDADSPTEKVKGSTIRKGATVDGEAVTLDIDLTRRGARCTVLSGNTLSAYLVARRILGLVTDPSAFETKLAAKVKLRALIGDRRGLRIPQTATVFEAMAWSIVGQQVNLAFAFKLRRVMIELAGTRNDGVINHPDAAAVARLDYSDLTSRQYSRSKAAYLIDTARLVARGALEAESWPQRSASATTSELQAVRGIGPWSANYVMMRGCGFGDCVPLGDTGLTSSLREFFKLDERPDARRTEELMRHFAPHRSLATFHLWMRKGDPA